MSPSPSFSLTPMYGLGAHARHIGSIAISQPRNSKFSVNRIYNYWKHQVGSYQALQYIQTSVFGKARILNGKTLVLV
jgi:hypothetical protein